MNTCKTCRLASLPQSRCQLTGLPITADDFCSKHVTEDLNFCQSCRKFLLAEDTILIKNGNNHLIYCQSCASKLSACAYCRNAQICEFETNADPTPKVTLQQVRKGNMVMQTQIKNPERIKKFCHSCTCWSAETEECYKEYGIGCDKS